MINALIRLCLLILLLTSIEPGMAAAGGFKGNLQPEEGFFGIQIAPYYYVAVSERLLSSKPIVRRCQTVFLPSFSPESAVYLLWDDEKPGDVPKVVSVEMERQLWSELHRLIEDEAPDKSAYYTGPEAQLKVLPKLQLQTKRNEASIDVQTAKVLDRLWRIMTSQTRFPDNAEYGLDGETIHFAAPAKGGYRTGKVWSPSKGTPVYDLVEIAKRLRNYPQLPEAERMAESKTLSKMAQKLLTKAESTK